MPKTSPTVSKFALQAVLLSLLLLPAACASSGPIEPDFTPANEIPNRPGIIENLGGKPLEIGF